MSNGSPTAYLVWAILSCFFFGFLTFHLWRYDGFLCLRWNAGRQPGAFKRVMTYTYVAAVPLLVVFSVATTVLKFKEGFFLVPGGYSAPCPVAIVLKATDVLKSYSKTYTVLERHSQTLASTTLFHLEWGMGVGDNSASGRIDVLVVHVAPRTQ